MTSEEIAPILKMLRIKSGKVQREIAEHIGVAVSTITHIERGRRLPSLEILLGWIEYCGGSLYIVHQNDPQNPTPPNLRRLVEKCEALPSEDIRRMEEVAHALSNVDGLTRDVITFQLDAIGNATRKSSDSAHATGDARSTDNGSRSGMARVGAVVAARRA